MDRVHFLLALERRSIVMLFEYNRLQSLSVVQINKRGTLRTTKYFITQLDPAHFTLGIIMVRVFSS